CSLLVARLRPCLDPVSIASRELMILDTARLLLFPALMAFAAASDLFTMTISNRVSLGLVAGFLIFAVLGGRAPYAIPLLWGEAPRLSCWPSSALPWDGSAAVTPRWRPVSRSGSVLAICWTISSTPP